MAYIQNIVFAGMTDEELNKFAKQYASNIKVAPMVKEEQDYRVEVAREAKVKADFEAKVLELANLPKPPEAIHNVYMAWREVEDFTKPEVVVVDGKPTNRFPKAWKWVVETNHADKVVSGQGTSTTSSGTKRAITVYKVVAGKLVWVGNYSAGSKACADLSVDAGMGSANLALSKSGYLVQPKDDKALTEAGLSTTIKS